MGLLRMLGLGFSFHGRDDGLEKTMRTERDGLLGIYGAIRRLNDEFSRKSVFGRARMIMGFARDVSTATSDIVGDIGRNLSGPLESAFVAADMVGARAQAAMGDMAAGWGNVRKQVARLSISMNRDAGVVADAFKGMAGVGKESTDTIFGGIKNVVRITDVFGVSASDMGLSVSKLRNLFSLSDKEIRQVFDDVTALGRRFGATDVFLQSAAKIVGALGDEYAVLQKRLSPGETTRLIRSVVGFAGALRKAGESPGEAIEKSLSLLQFLSKEKNVIERMRVGLEADLPEMTKELAINLGSVGSAFEKMQDSPLAFARAMSELVQRVGADRLKKSLGALGPGFLNVVANSKSAMTALERLAAEERTGGLSGKDGTLERMSKELFRVGRTTQESFDLMKASFDTKIRGITAPMIRDWLRNMRGQFDEAGGNIKKWASDDGALGSLVRGFLRLDQIGVGGILAEINSGFLVLGPGIERSMKLAGQAGFALMGLKAAAGLAFVGIKAALFTPLGLLMTGFIAAMATGGEKSASKFSEGFQSIMKGEFMEGLSKIGDGIVEASKTWWRRIKDWLSKTIGKEMVEGGVWGTNWTTGPNVPKVVPTLPPGFVWDGGKIRRESDVQWESPTYRAPGPNITGSMESLYERRARLRNAMGNMGATPSMYDEMQAYNAAIARNREAQSLENVRARRAATIRRMVETEDAESGEGISRAALRSLQAMEQSLKNLEKKELKLLRASPTLRGVSPSDTAKAAAQSDVEARVGTRTGIQQVVIPGL